MLLNASLLLTFISICLHNQAFYGIFQRSVDVLNQLNGDQNAKNSIRNLIIYHNMVKDWFLETSDVYGVYILAQLVFSMLFLACVVFQLDLEFQHIDFNILTLLMAATISGLNLFLYCYYGKLATESFLSMGDCLYESNWQDLPIQLQQHLRFMINYMQLPIYYRGWNLKIATLNLETFITLIKTVVTNYMMFKTITADSTNSQFCK
ncbi:odorant receptor 82a-like [Sitodiplosis mosellana]|uniref:odorant receptor 82a-like n=1 Tax=Sitodiplosis mosellana TaxID=263140 RepID=UPI0024445136|nr:odorant receptor 82a-like [Sitodiplosis mosellana]